MLRNKKKKMIKRTIKQFSDIRTIDKKLKDFEYPEIKDKDTIAKGINDFIKNIEPNESTKWIYTNSTNFLANTLIEKISNYKDGNRNFTY